MYSTPNSLGRILFYVGHLCMSLISTLSNLVGSRYSCTIPLAFWTMTKLLLYSDISSTFRGTIFCYFCSYSSSSLWGFWSSYTTFSGGTWYGWLPSFTCNSNMPSKNPISVRISLNSLWILCAANWYALLSDCICAGPEITWHVWIHIYDICIIWPALLVCVCLQLGMLDGFIVQVSNFLSTCLPFTVSMPNSYMWSIHNSAGLSPGTTKNLHLITLPSYLNLTVNTPNWSLLDSTF